MKTSSKIFALMVALAAGTASAAGTVAGTPIKNIATATFEDPTGAAGNTDGKATSNEVTTTVLPKPEFDLRFQGNTPTDGGTQNTLDTTTSVKTGAVPGQIVSTSYSVVNNGNVALSVVIKADTTGSAAGVVVKYYDAGGTELQKVGGEYVVAVAADDPATGPDEGKADIIQRVTVPAGATRTDVYGASPEGSVAGTGTGAGQNGIASGVTLQESQATKADGTVDTQAAGYQAEDTDRQFTRVMMYAPTLDNDPNPTTTPSSPVDPDGNPITVPAPGNVDAPTETVGKTGDNTPVVSAPGYVTPNAPASDPTPGGTPIVPNVAGDEQIAYPRADANANDDTVVFTNTLKNNAATTDRVQLFPVGTNGELLSGTTFDATSGVFTLPGGVKVRFLHPTTGAALLPAAPYTDADSGVLVTPTYPTLTVPGGSTAVYRTEVTFPDPDDAALITAITVEIGADSLKDAGTVSDSTTRNTIRPPAAQFGDSTGSLGAVSTPAPVQVVDPSRGTAGISSPDVTDRTAVFPMDVVNHGQYQDSFTLSGTVGITGAAVRYYDAGGTELPKDTNGKYITPVVAPGAEIKVYAVVDVPERTPANDYTVSQTAVGNYSTVALTDTNDIIRVSVVGGVAVAKFVALAGVAAGSDPAKGINNPVDYTATGATSARPADTISYRILGKNNYNTTVKSFFMTDTVPANTEFVSTAVNPGSVKTIYRYGGGWTATAPAAGLAADTVIDIAADADNNNLPDDLAADATLTVDFIVKVK
jgi:uncharacterized repeat protein (TIGR01451 family)